MATFRGAKNRGKKVEDKNRINEKITCPQVRLIGEEGEQIGVVEIEEAMAISRERGYDLVELSPTADPPVCKIMDYGKHKYQESKRIHDAKKKQKQIVIKEIKLRPKTEEHDFQVKLKHASNFLNDGNKVKVTVMFRGRELVHKDIGIRVLEKFADSLEDKGIVEQQPKAEGKTATLIISPKLNKG